MAENLDDGEFWLPPHFLTDDSTSVDNNCTKNVEVFNDKNFDVLNASFPSDLSSESLLWSSETESNNDEYHIADLTRHMTHQLDLDLSQNFKSPNSVHHLNTHRATWDLLHAAAGEVEKMMLLVPHKNPSTVTQTNSGVGFYTNQYLLAHQQFQLAKEQEMQQQQGLVWGNTNTSMQLNGYSGNYQWGQSNYMVANGVRNIDGGVIEVGTNMGLYSCPWPHTLQANQQYGCDMRAVNLGNPPVKRESTGTGFFLPRGVVHSPEKLKKKKPASSNAWVRTRVLQAQDSNQLHHRSNEALSTDYESAYPKIGNKYDISQQKRNRKLQPPRMNHKTQLLQ